jgi:hypothetical protein
MYERSNTYQQICSIVSTQLDSGTAETGTTRVYVDANIPYSFTNGDPIFLAKIRDEQIGVNDTSIASSNIIVGYNSCNDITLGSKNIALGDNTLNNVTTEKYNTAIGTSSGFSVKSDNNFLLGTKTGYYIDHVASGNGENTMIGYATGQFAGYNSEATNNLYIGNRAAQINQGSNNIFIGNETETAISANIIGNTEYSNKLIIYKSDCGVPSNPLIGGDLSENKVGILTIEPKSSLDVKGSFGKSISNVLQFTSTIDYGITAFYPRYWDKIQPSVLIENTVENTINLPFFTQSGFALIDSELMEYDSIDITGLSINNIIRNDPEHHLKGSRLFNIAIQPDLSELSINIPDSGVISLVSTEYFNDTGITGLAIIDSEVIQYNGKNQSLGQAVRNYPKTLYPSIPSVSAFHSSGTTCYNIASSITTLYYSDLSTSINSTVDKIPVIFDPNMGNIPSNGNLIIDSEIISYPDNTYNFFNVTRGTNSTSAASHSALSSYILVSSSTNLLFASSLEEGISAGPLLPDMVLVNDLSRFANEGYFILENEILQYSSISLINITRGFNESTQVSHPINSPITLISNTINNLIYDTLDQSITDAVTLSQIILNDASEFPNSGYILIGDEIIGYNSKISNILKSINRVVPGSIPKPHFYGDFVYLITNLNTTLNKGTINTLNINDTIVKFIDRNNTNSTFTKQGIVLVNSELIKFSNTVLYQITRGIGGTTTNQHNVGTLCNNFTEPVIEPSQLLTIKDSINDTTQTITIETIDTRLPVSGTILIESELITYSNGIGLIGVSRGIASTIAASHNLDTLVYIAPSLGITHSTLKYSIQDDETGIPVVDNSLYSTSGLVLIDNEIISFANKNTLDNVIRGASYSITASHLANTNVYNIDIDALNIITDINGNYILPSITIDADKVLLSDTISGIKIEDGIDVNTFPSSGTISMTTETFFSDIGIRKQISGLTRGTNLTGATAHYINDVINLIDTTVNNNLYKYGLPIAINDTSDEINISENNPPTPTPDPPSSSGIIIIESEIITYTGLSIVYNYTQYKLTGCTRGSFGTTAASHNQYLAVYKVPITNVLTNNLYQAINNTDTTISFKYNNLTDFSSSGTVLVGSEIITYTSDNLLNIEQITYETNKTIADITRGTNSTSISNHLENDKIFLISEGITALQTSTLTVACSNNSTNILVNNAIFNTSGGFIIINSEIILYTGTSISGLTLTGCYRGVFQTLPVLHTIGSTVYKVPIDNIKRNYLLNDINIIDRIVSLGDVNLPDFSAIGTILIGSEIITYQSKNALGKLTRGINSTIPYCYVDETDAKLKAVLLNDQDSIITVDTTTDNIRIDLPSAIGIKGRIYTIKKIVEENTVTVEPYLSELIDDLSTINLTNKNSFIEIQSNGIDWILLSHTPFAKDYLALNVVGSSNNSLYTVGDIEKTILILDSTYWAGTLPNPENNLDGYLQKRGNLTYDKSTGIISGLNIKKTYKVEVFAGLDLNSAFSPLFTIKLKNYSTESLEDFDPDIFNKAINGSSNISLRISCFLSNCSSFTLINKLSGTHSFPITSNFTISIMEI